MDGIAPFDPTGAYQARMQALIKQLQGESAADQATRNAGIQRALVQGGFTFSPEQANAAGLGNIGDVWNNNKTQQLIQDANRAGLSQSYRIDQANADTKRQIINSLAARGILRSGETGFGLNRQNTAYQQAQYDARQHILDVISGIQQAYVAAERQRQSVMLQAALQGANL